MISVILTRLIHGLDMPDFYRPPGGRAGLFFTRTLTTRLEESNPGHIWRNTRIRDRPRWNRLLSPEKLARIESNLHRLDRAEVRFLIRYGPPVAGSPDPRVLLDMLALTDLPGPVGLALSQTLSLLPRVSATQTVGGVQTYPEGGYEGLDRKGSMDSLLLTELIYPDDIFLHRLFNNEALYYGRESSRDRRRELAYIVVQAGWGLGLDGRVMARALTLGLAQAMGRRGYEVRCSFAGQDLGQPFRPDKPGEVGRILHYREEGTVNVEKVLKGVLRQLRNWQERYQGRQVLWVLGEHFDADWHEDHESLYRDLSLEGGQQAWYIHVGKTGTVSADPPPTARYFEAWHLLETGLMWEGREDDPLAGWSGPARPEKREPDSLWTELGTGMPFVYVHGGKFMMGDILDDGHHKDEKPVHELELSPYYMGKYPVTFDEYDMFMMGDTFGDGFDREKPVHEVELSPYYMGKYPVTFDEYDMFCKETGREKPDDENWGRGRWPVINVSWEDANAFAEWLSEKTGHTFRLPTEAEWEYAARSGGMEHRYSGTSEEDELGQYAWYWGNSGRKTHPVGEKKPNALGIHDMSGNVREWCQDIYAEDAYSKHQDNDPIYMPSGSSRVLRSGSWTSGARSCRSAFRRATSPGGRGNDLGFRLLRTP